MRKNIIYNQCEQHNLDSARHWYERGKQETDPFDKFIDMWISYNAIYGDTHGKHEIDRVANCVGNIYSRNAQKCNILLSTEDAQYFGKRKIVDCKNSEYTTEDSRAKIEYYNPSNYKSCAEAFENLIKCIYKVRCNLFHGDKTPSGPADFNDDTEIVTHAGAVMQSILDIYFSEGH